MSAAIEPAANPFDILLRRFLVEGPLGNILHTGDVRAEPKFLEAVSRNPCLQKYIPPSMSFPHESLSQYEKPLRILDAIHLDTACLLSHHEIPGKVSRNHL